MTRSGGETRKAALALAGIAAVLAVIVGALVLLQRDNPSPMLYGAEGRSSPVTDGPPVPANYRVVLQDRSSLGPVRLDAGGDDAVLNTYAYRIAVQASALLDQVSVAGNPVVAGPGRRILVAEVRVGKREKRESIVDRLDRLELTMEVGGVQEPVDLRTGVDGTQTIIASVPTGEPVELVASETDISQSISLVDGRRVESLDVLHRAQVGVTIEKEHTLPYDPGYARTPGEVYETNVVIEGARLVWWWYDGVTPSARDRAFLVVSSRTPGLLHEAPAPERMILTLPDGTTVTPRQDRRSIAFTDTTAWEVPASFTEGTITIAPGRVKRGGNPVDYGDSRIDLQVRIPNA